MTTDIQTTIKPASIQYADLLRLVPFGQSQFANEFFVVNQNHTPHRKLRQVLLQYDQICNTILQCDIKAKRTLLDKQEKDLNLARTVTRQLESADDAHIFKQLEIEIKRLELDLREIEINQSQAQKLLEDALAEKAQYELLIAKILPSVLALEEQGIDFEKAESLYWQARFTEETTLAKAANTIGCDKEILKAILQMDNATRDATLKSIGTSADDLLRFGLIGNKQENGILGDNPFRLAVASDLRLELKNDM